MYTALRARISREWTHERLLALEETAEPSLYAKWRKKRLIEILYDKAKFRTD